MPNEMSFEDYVRDNLLNQYKRGVYTGLSKTFDEDTAIDKKIMMAFIKESSVIESRSLFVTVG